MNVIWTLLNLAGAVALLLWGLHMVQTGIQRAFGPDLHRFLSTALRHRLGAFAAGLGVTAVLQSSTATSLMLSGLAASGAVALAPALAVMLGANVGTTLIVQVISFDVATAAPVLILLGVLLFRRASRTRPRDLGRVAIGLGLLLLALRELLLTVMPLEDVPALGMLFDLLTGQWVLDVLLGAALAWAAHSSVAVVLLVMSFSAKGLLPLAAAWALVLGANLGTAVNPVLEAGGENPAARRLPIGNLLLRTTGVVIALPLLPHLAAAFPTTPLASAQAVALFHTGFNLALAALFLPVLIPYAALLVRLLPNAPAADDPARPRYLDALAQDNSPLALAAAAREALRMADLLEAMLRQAACALPAADRRQIAETQRLDDALDSLHQAIRVYLAPLDGAQLTEADRRRLREILVFTANLEAAADVLDHNLLAGAQRRIKRGLAMSATDGAAASGLLNRLASTLRAAAAVFLTKDASAARLLVTEKEAFRALEDEATTGQAGSLHLDVLRDLKQINAHLVAAAAYPVLAEHGRLLPSRALEDK